MCYFQRWYFTNKQGRNVIFAVDHGRVGQLCELKDLQKEKSDVHGALMCLLIKEDYVGWCQCEY